MKRSAQLFYAFSVNVCVFVWVCVCVGGGGVNSVYSSSSSSYMDYPISTLPEHLHSTILSVRGALFLSVPWYQYFLTFGGAPEFQRTYHGFYILFTFYIFLSGFFHCWCERNTGRHFIGFY